MTEERKLPQLVMKNDNLFELPELICPPGFHIRSFQSGDEQHWEQLVSVSFGRERDFQTAIGSHPYFHPERVIFIFFGDTPVATATAWFQDKLEEEAGYLHMVGAHPDYAGWGLGYAVSLAALLQMRKEGKLKAVLQTDDFRIPAIKTYLKLAFQPVDEHESHKERWSSILSKLQPAHLEER
ncbi:hypothetical protein Back11_36870 [Paenibacillus baekrokdamisoli]|uniref:Uncharacterized protein n=1 Tax=Paenibacillus baekrokdamisoli TaxID=1712516 RepID=A0A3G9IVP0_9BACL|nr:GNAT family N-acetyltransferase [Paenibacillus baekrokdamisoli]MBB3072606.1 mycothiol synthase [Paenibacillus baekrokdamisoli]BBH22342.1 hypothetical protein Back11_36870 [Paenibacillus baekrokdamisoli]